MLKSVLEFALTRRVMVLATLGIFLAGGIAAFLRLNIEAYPNPAPPILEIVAQNPGQSAEEIERFITIPIEIGIASTPGLRYVRSVSLYGLSFVRAQFTYDTDYYFAYQQTTNKLNALTLPAGVQPSISPSSLTGEIYRYQLVGPPGYSLMDLKTLETWVLERRLKTVPGVRDVTGWGGPNKEYHVDVDLERLAAYGLTLPQVLTAMGNSNINVGGRELQVGEQSVNIRGIGLINSVDDIKNTIITQANGVPIYVRDIANVEVGYTPRLGIAGRDHQDDVVLAIVLMQRDDKTLDVVKNVEAEIARINAGGILPDGVKIVPYYDRGELVHVTVGTVLHNLTYGVILIFLIQWIFLGNLRSAIIVAATIPCALLSAVFVLVMRGDSANLLSVGSLDLGIIVDGSVIMVENIFRRLQRDDHTPMEPQGTASHRKSWAPLTGDIWSEKTRQIFRAASEVDKSILFSVAITIAAFIPLFTMQGIEGQIFGPMAKTYAYALIGALVAAFTVTPVLASVILPRVVEEKETLVVRLLDHVYHRLLAKALRHRLTVLAGVAALVIITGSIVPFLGTEFLPKLEEGNLWIRASLPKTISIDAGRKVVTRIREVLLSYPEVVTVVSQHGRPDDGTDAAGFFNAEFFAPLKPFDQWPRGVTKDKLVADMQARFDDEFIGVEFNFSQYIQDNVEEATSGVKGENSVKLFGRDLTFLEQKGNEIKDQMAKVRGVQDLGLFSVLGQPNLLVKIDRTASARYGFAPADVNAVVQTALAGQTATMIYEGERQFPLVARLLPQYRDSVEAIRNIQIANQNTGGPTTYVPLSAVADISMQSGASYIYRENNERYIPIKFSVRDRDLGGTVAEAQKLVARNVKLPAGYHLEWSGEFGALQEAKARLAIIVPLSVLLIMLLLYSLFNSVVKSLLALTTIPFAACGGLLALYVSGLNFSISSAIGFVSLFGVSVMDGILMLTYYTQLHQGGMPQLEAIQQAAETRMRQILMTAMSACIGLLPAAMSTGIGAQVQRPLATVVVGGMLLAPILTLFAVPVLGTFFLPDEQSMTRVKRRVPPPAQAPPEGAPAE